MTWMDWKKIWDMFVWWLIGLFGWMYECLCFLIMEESHMSYCEFVTMGMLICLMLSGMMVYLGRVFWRSLWG